MDFSLNDEHIALRDAVQRFCSDAYPAPQRGNPQPQESARQRRQAMAELGLLGLPFAADCGGSEQGAVEAMLVAQELGRALADWTFVSSTLLAGQLIEQLGSAAQQQQWLPPLASGARIGALAVHEAGQRYQWNHVTCRAERLGDAWVLQGAKHLVPGGDAADLLLVVARTAGHDGDIDGLSVFALDAATPGLRVQGFDTLDNRRSAHLYLADVRVGADRLLGTAGCAGAAIDAVLDAATAAVCAEAVGAVQALLHHTAEHLRTRKQFGAPLAKFQVLQHRVADMAIALEQIKSMACVAAMAVQAGEPVQRRRLVSAAKVLVSQKGREIGLAAIQMHGAMGMTDECRVGHYAKRLMVIGQMFGDAPWHLQRMQQAHATPQ